MGNEKEYSKKELDEVEYLKEEYFQFCLKSIAEYPTELVAKMSKYPEIFSDKIEVIQKRLKGKSF